MWAEDKMHSTNMTMSSMHNAGDRRARNLYKKFLMQVSCTISSNRTCSICTTVQEICTRKIWLQVAMTDMQVSCLSFLYVCHRHKKFQLRLGLGLWVMVRIVLCKMRGARCTPFSPNWTPSTLHCGTSSHLHPTFYFTHNLLFIINLWMFCLSSIQSAPNKFLAHQIENHA